MWVFGYGSLMWDGWQTQYGCIRVERGALANFRRDFNKASVERWGSREKPGPTLGLAASAGAKCEGLSFELPDESREQVLNYLRNREGESFALKEMEVDLQSGVRVVAFVPVNDTSKNTYIGAQPLKDRATMAKAASGSGGSCETYVTGVHEKLRQLSIHDSGVEEFWNAMSSLP
jgi:glutathione-specific gamma-glutamylcyclotransferase